ALIGRLGMADGSGRPYVIPMPFCWWRGAIYLRVPMSGRKGEILGKNDRVCFEVDACAPRLEEYASVLVEGRLVEVGDVEEKRQAKAANGLKYERLRRGHRPGHGRSTPIEQLAMRKIVVESISGRRKDPPADSDAD